MLAFPVGPDTCTGEHLVHPETGPGRPGPVVFRSDRPGSGLLRSFVRAFVVEATYASASLDTKRPIDEALKATLVCLAELLIACLRDALEGCLSAKASHLEELTFGRTALRRVLNGPSSSYVQRR